MLISVLARSRRLMMGLAGQRWAEGGGPERARRAPGRLVHG